MRFFLSRLHYPVTTLGPGRRIGIWFQGCSLRCPGCISSDTWTHGVGETTVSEVLEALSSWLPDADGITISGGEPFEQIEALECLLHALREASRDDQDVLVYSGKAWEEISSRVLSWQGLADAVISDPFLSSAPQSLAWRGSDNQRMTLLTDLGRARFTEWLEASRAKLPKALDVCFHGDTVWMAGIPDAGTLASVKNALAEAGFSSTTTERDPSRPVTLPLIFA